MKLSYRQAAEMTGLGGMVYRGRIMNKIAAGYWSQPEVKTEALKVAVVGLVGILAVVLLAVLLVSEAFGVVGSILVLTGMFFALPSKKLPLYELTRMDEQFEVDNKGQEEVEL